MDEQTGRPSREDMWKAEVTVARRDVNRRARELAEAQKRLAEAVAYLAKAEDIVERGAW